MQPKHNQRLKLFCVNFFGVLAYMAITLQILVALLAYFEPLKALFELAVPTNKVDQPVIPPPSPSTDQPEPSMLLIIMTVVIVVVMMAVTIYAIIKIPSSIAKVGKKIINQTATASTPLALKISGRKNTAKNRLKITPILKFIFKLIMIILPLVATLFSFMVEHQHIDYSILQIAALFCAGVSFVLFVTQYGMAKLLNLKQAEVW